MESFLFSHEMIVVSLDSDHCSCKRERTPNLKARLKIHSVKSLELSGVTTVNVLVSGFGDGEIED